MINNGAASTNNLSVTLSFAADDDAPELFDDISEIKLSNKPDLSDASYRPFGQNLPWQLAASTTNGQIAKVYGMVKDGAGNESLIIAGQIRFVSENGQAGSVKVYLPTVLK